MYFLKNIIENWRLSFTAVPEETKYHLMISHAPVKYNLTIDYSGTSRFLHRIDHGSIVYQINRRIDLNHNTLLIFKVFSA